MTLRLQASLTRQRHPALLSAARRPDLSPKWPGFCTFLKSCPSATWEPRLLISLAAWGSDCALGFR